MALTPPTSEQQSKICELISQGGSISETCKVIGINQETLRVWRLDHEDFDASVLRALTLGFDVIADSLLNIDEQIQDVQRARLRSDNVKWILSRRDPGRYGDRIAIDVTQTVDLTLAMVEAKKRILLPMRDQLPIIDVEPEAAPALEQPRPTDNVSVDSSHKPSPAMLLEQDAELEDEADPFT